jgi:hypothetical protein
LFGQKPHIADQVGHAKLDRRAAVGHVLVVGREIVAADHAAERLAQHRPQHRAAARRRQVSPEHLVDEFFFSRAISASNWTIHVSAVANSASNDATRAAKRSQFSHLVASMPDKSE